MKIPMKNEFSVEGHVSCHEVSITFSTYTEHITLNFDDDGEILSSSKFIIPGYTIEVCKRGEEYWRIVQIINIYLDGQKLKKTPSVSIVFYKMGESYVTIKMLFPSVDEKYHKVKTYAYRYYTFQTIKPIPFNDNGCVDFSINFKLNRILKFVDSYNQEKKVGGFNTIFPYMDDNEFKYSEFKTWKFSKKSFKAHKRSLETCFIPSTVADSSYSIKLDDKTGEYYISTAYHSNDEEGETDDQS